MQFDFKSRQHIIIIIIIIIIRTLLFSVRQRKDNFFDASQFFFFFYLYHLMINKLLHFQAIHFSMQMKNTPGGMNLSQLKWKCRNKQEAEK